ncbi:MAG: glycosyltransferase family 4 protein [Candidatus Binatia bacterium]
MSSARSWSRLGIDVRKLGDGGIGTYIRDTLTAICGLAPELRVVAFGAPGGERLALPNVEWMEVPAGKYSLAEHVLLPAAARRSGVDLFHAPHYVLPIGLSCPSVVTVHDLIHVLLPRTPLHWLYARFMIASACRRARRVIVVSETTARDLRDLLGVPSEKIRVVPNGVDSRFRRLPEETVRPHLERLGVRRPYVLFVGNCLPHKNVASLVRAWGGLEEPRPDLVLCGSGYDRAADVWRAADEVRGRKRIRTIGTLSDEALVALYNGADLLASASLYEGFGLPVLEAFACGTPVLAPRTGAVPEIAGDGALLVPPQRVDLLTSGMYRLLRDRDLREELVEKGSRRVRSFSWEEAARQTLSVYAEVTSDAR